MYDSVEKDPRIISREWKLGHLKNTTFLSNYKTNTHIL